jgi:hypothetical protein
MLGGKAATQSLQHVKNEHNYAKTMGLSPIAGQLLSVDSLKKKSVDEIKAAFFGGSSENGILGVLRSAGLTIDKDKPETLIAARDKLVSIGSSNHAPTESEANLLIDINKGMKKHDPTFNVVDFVTNLQKNTSSVDMLGAAKALNMVNARANTLMGYAESKGINMPGMDSGMLSKIMTGEHKGRLSKDQVSALSNIMGVSSDVVRGYEKSDTLGVRLANQEAQTGGKGLNQEFILKQELDKLIDAGANRNWDGSVTIKNGDKDERLSSHQYEARLKKTEDNIFAERIKGINPGDTSRGSGIYSNVSPPVLNYWNNRWVL